MYSSQHGQKKNQRCHYELEPCSESHTVDIKACDDSMIAKVYMTTESSPRASLQCVHSPNTWCLKSLDDSASVID